MLLTYRKDNFRTAKEGFSFIELVVAIAIIALLAAVGIPMYMSYVEKAKVTKTEGILGNLKIAVNSYYLDANKYPNTLTDLVRKPTDVKKWHGPYLESGDIPDDGWGNPFVYRLTPKAAHPFDIFTEGPKGDKYSVWEIGK